MKSGGKRSIIHQSEQDWTGTTCLFPLGGVALVSADEAPGGHRGLAGLVAVLAVLYVVDHRPSPVAQCFHKTFPAAPRRAGGGGGGEGAAEKYQKSCGLCRGRVTRAGPQTSCKNNSGAEWRAWADAMFVCWYIPGVCFIFPALSPRSLSSQGLAGWGGHG